MIFFDIDDTLLDTKTSQNVAAKGLACMYPGRIADPVKFAETWDELTRRHMGRYLSGEISFQEQRRYRVRESFSGNLSDREADKIFGDYRRIYEESWKLFPDVLESLEQLAGFRLAIITNGDKSNQTYKLDRLGLSAHFEAVVTPACAGVAKPGRGIFEFAASVTSTTANECWYVGDSLELDYQGALSSGYNSVWLNRSTSAETCENQCRDLYGFLKILRGGEPASQGR